MNKLTHSAALRSVPDTVSAILALILGMVGVILSLLSFLPCLGWVAIIPGLLCSIPAIILGAVAVKRSDDRAYSVARGGSDLRLCHPGNHYWSSYLPGHGSGSCGEAGGCP